MVTFLFASAEGQLWRARNVENWAFANTSSLQQSALSFCIVFTLKLAKEITCPIKQSDLTR